MPLADPIGRCVDLGAVGDVADLRLGAELGRNPLEPLGSTRQQDASPAAFGQEPCRGGPDPAGPSGDDGDANTRNSRLLAP
jgi:hypothetical protein